MTAITGTYYQKLIYLKISREFTTKPPPRFLIMHTQISIRLRPCTYCVPIFGQKYKKKIFTAQSRLWPGIFAYKLVQYGQNNQFIFRSQICACMVSGPISQCVCEQASEMFVRARWFGGGSCLHIQYIPLIPGHRPAIITEVQNIFSSSDSQFYML